ncbi:unnamed protein product [Nezara viridula]|uniref:Uncharacterized protein n=1 Tax=Nezara viridula TaxID=85310 RepID=A0A9P0HF13_NEZVI|nr:unnamed protein product [Nezara viridula]
MIVCTHSKEAQEVLERMERGHHPGFRSSSQGQVNSQQLLLKNVPEFISAWDWPSGSPDLNPLDYRFGPNWRGWHATEHNLTYKASNNLWSEQLSAFLKKCWVLLLMTGHGD